MRNVIECVLNFSEGRDQARIQALVTAMSGIPGSAVLGCHSDADHNRSVITIAGEPEAVAEAALRGVGMAAELIDLTRHTGVHPRIGAADVVPFVPVEGWSLEQCAALAHRVGRQIWERYHVPVYFYGAAAMKTERVALEDVRRGQFEGLREVAAHLPGRAPDVGGPLLHPTAGAVAVGARRFLIACNVNLQTTDLAIARNIATAIRFSSGGLSGVKAMGVSLEKRGMVQVSMNLTDYSQTSLELLFDTVRREAERCGCAVASNEIVGLVPREALAAGGGGKSLLHVLPGQVLENRIAQLLPCLPGAELSARTASNEAALGGIPLKDMTR